MTVFAAIVFLVWLVNGLGLAAGMLFFTPTLRARPPAAGPRPKVSLIFGYRDEEDLELPLATMLAQRDADVEVIAVNDRSRPGAEIKAEHPRLKHVSVDALPQGWLGKNHALWRGWQASSGEWLLFTDADVYFSPVAVAAAVAEARRRGLDHLTLYPKLLRRGVPELMFTTAFAFSFHLYYRPWAARFRFSPDFAGIGAFNLVRRSVYEKIGTHARLPFDVADDMVLGKLIKRSGARQMAMYGHEAVAVRWVHGFRGIVSSLKKNAFAGLGYSVPFLVFATAAQVVAHVLPFVFALTAEGAEALLWRASIAVILAVYLASLKYDRPAALAFPLHPFSAMLFLYVVWISALSALKHGGVEWRGTRYGLEELRRKNSL